MPETEKGYFPFPEVPLHFPRVKYLPRNLRLVHANGEKQHGKVIMTPLAAIEKYQRLTIVAPLGAGKTALLKNLAITCCKDTSLDDKNPIIPLFISLWSWIAKKKTLSNYIFDTIREYAPEMTAQKMEKLLELGQCLLLLDSGDEVPDDKNRLSMITIIEKLTNKYPDIPVVITCRGSSNCHDINGFTRFTLEPLSVKDIEHIITATVSFSRRIQGEGLIKLIKSTEDIFSLAQNPLMLYTITVLADKIKEKSPSRVEILKQLMELLLFKWENVKKLPSQFSPGQKYYILRKLAYTAYSHHRRSITEKEILETIATNGPGVGIKAEDHASFLYEIWQRNGFFEQVGPSLFEFFHLTFQEYLTALEISNQPNNLDTIISHLTEPSWRGVVHYYAGLQGDAGPLIGRILDNEEDDIFYNRLMLAGRCLFEAGQTSTGLRNMIIQRLWNIYLLGEYPLVRSKAAEVLALLKPPHIINELLDQLTDSDAGVRRAAVQTLGIIGTLEALPALMMIFLKEKERAIRCDAAMSLGQVGGQIAIVLLLFALREEKDPPIRRCVAEALGTTGETDIAPDLFIALENDKDYRVREGAAVALGTLACPDSVPRLIKAMANEKQNSVRWRIVMSIGKIDIPESKEFLIYTLANDLDPDVRNSAAEALGYIDGPESIQTLIQTLKTDKIPEVRGCAAFSLGNAGSEEAMPELIEALITDESLEVRGRAAFALGRIKKIDALPYLTAVFNAYQDSFIRGNTTFAIGEIAGIEAIPFLIQALLLEKDPYVRFQAAEALGDVGNILTIPHLQNALQDTSTYFGWRIKDKVFEALEKISKRFQVFIPQTPPTISQP